MRKLKIQIQNVNYTIQLNIKETGSNYNIFATIKNDKGAVLYGTSFKDNTPDSDIIEWAKNLLNPTSTIISESYNFIGRLYNLPNNAELLFTYNGGKFVSYYFFNKGVLLFSGSALK